MTTCTPTPLPPVKADFCDPVINFGEIDKIYVGNQGRTPFTDWATLSEWEAVLDNDDIVDVEKIRTLPVIASKPAGETTEINFSQGRTTRTEKKHSIPIKIDEVDDLNYAFLQFTEENPAQQYKVWWQVGKFLYGGNEGVDSSIFLNEITPESKEELQYFEGSLDFEGKSPARILNPLA